MQDVHQHTPNSIVGEQSPPLCMLLDLYSLNLSCHMHTTLSTEQRMNARLFQQPSCCDEVGDASSWWECMDINQATLQQLSMQAQ